MNFQKETTRKGFLTRLCHLTFDKDVQQGIGAVLVLIGFTLLLSGVIFVIVAYTGTKRDVIGTFPYVGPVLIIIGVLCGINGYILSHRDDFIQIWLYFKQRKQQAYVEEENCETQEINGSISVLCLRFLVCIFVRRNSREVTGAEEDGRHQRGVTSQDDQSKNTEKLSNRDKSSSFSPFRQTKVHPSISVTEV